MQDTNTKLAQRYLYMLGAYTVTVPEPMMHFIKVLQQSADTGKYLADDWLLSEGKGCGHKKMYSSIHRHVSFASTNNNIDKDSGLDHRLHAAVRLLMDYTRDQLGLIHSDDRETCNESI